MLRDCIDEPSDTVINALHRDAWRVLHLAGHGEHDLPVSDASPLAPCTACARPLEPRVVRRSGMLIGRNTLLTPGDVAQMRWVPELVFINCCHLGKTVSPTPRRYAALAANLGVQFIRMGVKAVVAAGWAVDDAAGRAFAQGLYARLLAGETFGEAVRAAREEVWVRFPEVNTWGAYQCYGDPSYRLVVAEGSRTRREQRRYHAPYELVADLENLTESIRTRLRGEGDDAAVLDELGNEIEETLRGIPAGQREAWLGRADVAAAVGNAWGETRAYAKAVEWLKRALEEGEGDCPCPPSSATTICGCDGSASAGRPCAGRGQAAAAMPSACL